MRGVVVRNEEAVVDAFVDLSARVLDTGAGEVIDTLTHLTARCVSLLDVAWAGVLVGPEEGPLHLLAPGRGDTAFDAVLSGRGTDGPWREASRRRQAVSVPDLDRDARWPPLREAAAAAGLRALHALPLCEGDEVLGVLCLAARCPGSLAGEDLALATALSHVAAVAMVNTRTASDLAGLNAQLQHALVSRVAVEQATGMLAQASGIDVAAAFAVLRGYARSRRRRLHDVARDVIVGAVPMTSLAAPRDPAAGEPR